MISKHWQGKGASSFKAAADYDLSKGTGCRWLCGNVSSGPQKATSEFYAIADLRPDIAKPCFRIVLSLPPGEQLDDLQWGRLAERYLEKLGIDTDNHQYSAVQHLDTDHHHVHMTVNRVGLNGKIWSRSNDGWKGRKAVAELEKEFGLTLTSGDSADMRMPTQRELAALRRTGLPPPRLEVLRRVDKAYRQSDDFPGFLAGLERAGVTVRANFSGRKVNGLSFAVDGHAFKGSKLGRKFGWKSLSSHLAYDEDRDFLTLRLLTEISASRRDVDDIIVDILAEDHPAPDMNGDDLDLGELFDSVLAEREAAASKPYHDISNSNERLRDVVKKALDDTEGQSVISFIRLVEREGIVVRANVARTAKVSGLAFAWPGDAHFRSGSWIGKAAKWSNLSFTHEFGGTQDEIAELRKRDGVWHPSKVTAASPTTPKPSVCMIAGRGHPGRRSELWGGLVDRHWPKKLSDRIRHVDNGVLYFDDGSKVRDEGHRMTGRGDPKLIAQVMAIEAEARGWQVVEAAGDAASLREIATECYLRKIDVKGETPEMESIVRQQVERLQALDKVRDKNDHSEPKPDAAAGDATVGSGRTSDEQSSEELNDSERSRRTSADEPSPSGP